MSEASTIRVLPPMAPKLLVDILEAFMMGAEGQVLLADIIEDCEELSTSGCSVSWMADALRAHGLRTRLCCDGQRVDWREEQEHLRLVVEDVLKHDMSLVDMMNQLPVKICLKAVPSARERIERLKQAVMSSELLMLVGSRIYLRAPEWVPPSEPCFEPIHPPVFVIYGGSDMPHESYETYRDEPAPASRSDVMPKKSSRKGIQWGKLVAQALDSNTPRSLDWVLRNGDFKAYPSLSVEKLMRNLAAEGHHSSVVVDDLTQHVRLRSFPEQLLAILEAFLRDVEQEKLSLPEAVSHSPMLQPLGSYLEKYLKYI